MPKPTIAVSKPTLVKVRTPSGKKQKVMGYPKFLFEMVELYNAGKLPVKRD